MAQVTSTNFLDLEDYFVKMAPDFSVFELAEKYYYDSNETSNHFKDLFFYKADTLSSGGFATVSTNFHRAMYLVYTTGTITSLGSEDDGYIVFPYKQGTQVAIVIKDSPITIESTANIDLILGVAF
jgi:hypothetical protein